MLGRYTEIIHRKDGRRQRMSQRLVKEQIRHDEEERK
jgi:hypothetical protein